MFKLSILAPFVLGICAAFAPCAYAQDSATNLSNAAGDSAVATARLSEAGVKTIVAVAGQPLRVAGVVVAGAGIVTYLAGDSMNRYGNEPLTISPATVMAQPAPIVPYDAQKAQPAQTTVKRTDTR